MKYVPAQKSIKFGFRTFSKNILFFLGALIVSSLVWLLGLLMGISASNSMKNSSPVRTAEKSVQWKNKGKVYYVTPQEKRRFDILLSVFVFSVLPVLLTGFILQFVFKIEIFGSRK